MWVALLVAFLSSGVWSDYWCSRLWIWLLCQAKAASPEGVVRFSYPVVARQLACDDGRRHRVPSRKVLRRALHCLTIHGLLVVDEWAAGGDTARDKGGAQGYLTVRLLQWPPADLRSSRGSDREGTASGPSLGGERAPEGDTKKREKERFNLKGDFASESSLGCDVVARFRETWNREVRGYNVRTLRERRGDSSLARSIQSFLKDCSNDWELVRASIRAFARQGFHRDRPVESRLGVDTLLRPSHRGDYIERGRDVLETPLVEHEASALAHLKTDLKAASAARAASARATTGKEPR